MSVFKETIACMLEVNDVLCLEPFGVLYFVCYSCDKYVLIRRMDGFGVGSLLPEAKVWAAVM